METDQTHTWGFTDLPAQRCSFKQPFNDGLPYRQPTVGALKKKKKKQMKFSHLVYYTIIAVLGPMLCFPENFPVYPTYQEEGLEETSRSSSHVTHESSRKH